MPESTAIAVFVLLALPGLLAVGLCETLTPARSQGASIRVVVAVVLSTISYLLLAVLHSTLGPGSRLVPNPSVLLDASTEDLASVFTPAVISAVGAACLIAVGASLLLVLQANHEILHRVCRRARLTRRCGYSCHWDAVVHRQGARGWVHVKFKDGDEYVGAIESHSDASDERSLLLNPVSKMISPGEPEAWGENEYLFIPDISTVRSMRIRVMPKEQKDGKARRWWPATARRSKVGPAQDDRSPSGATRDGGSDRSSEGGVAEHEQAEGAAADDGPVERNSPAVMLGVNRHITADQDTAAPSS
jgi:hypothetical protein